MRTNTIIQYIATDGAIFDTKEACEEHEASGASLSNCIYNNVMANISSTYNDDAGFNIIEYSDVTDFILNHFHTIKDIIEMHRT